jgi:hypothetical protein
VKKPFWVLVTILVVGLWTIASPAHAELVKACEVENPPANCETMWAVIAHVRLARQPIAAFNPPRCQSDFGHQLGMIADALTAGAIAPRKSRDGCQDGSQRHPQVTRQIRAKPAPLSGVFGRCRQLAGGLHLNDAKRCCTRARTVPANATVRFRFQASDENLGEMDCTVGTVCAIGYSRFDNGCASSPQVTWNNRVTVYVTVFQNWSTDWAREGR